MKILLTTDRSECSSAAADYLQKLPICDPIDVTVVSAIPTAAPVGFGGYPPSIQSMIEDEKKTISKHLDSLCGKFSETAANAESKMLVGSPSFEIVDLANDMQPDLIVMGAVGKSMIGRVILGSVSDYVATHAKCSALVIRHTSGKDITSPPRRVLIALGNCDQDRRLIDFMEQFDWPDSTQVHVLHVLEQSPWYHEDPIQEAKDYWAKAEQLVREHGDSVAHSISHLIPAQQVKIISAPSAGEALIDYAESNECDLIVAGDHHPGLLDRMMLGSASRYVLRHARCSVAIVRE